MNIGNILVIGNSGVGKSKLIRSVLGEKVSIHGWKNWDVLDKLRISESPELKFRLIDTMRFQPGYFNSVRAVKDVKEFLKEWMRYDGEENPNIDLIWLCVDGTSGNQITDTLKQYAKAITSWKNIPVIVVITKSYSKGDRAMNVSLAEQAFERDPEMQKKLHKIIPVVAASYKIDDLHFISPFGLLDLIRASNEFMPQGVKMDEKEMTRFIHRRKKVLTHEVIRGTIQSGISLGETPHNNDDLNALKGVQMGEIRKVATIYEQKRSDLLKEFESRLVTHTASEEALSNVLQSAGKAADKGVGETIIHGTAMGSLVYAAGKMASLLFSEAYLKGTPIPEASELEHFFEKWMDEEFYPELSALFDSLSVNDGDRAIRRAIIYAFEGKKVKTARAMPSVHS